MTTRVVALALLLTTSCGTSVDLGGSAGPADGASDAVVCPGLAPPSVDSTCEACNHGSDGCQANGCFNGFLCFVATHDCRAPTSNCDASAPMDDAKSD
jgi:hypothetical protein